MNRRSLIPLLGGLLLIGVAGLAQAGPRGNNDATGTIPDYGNRWRGVAVAFSTQTFVLISSRPADAGLGIHDWRFRELVNVADGACMLAPTATAFAAYSSTMSVVLSTGGIGSGGSWQVPGDGRVFGIWAPGTTAGGMGGSEHYWKKD